MASGALAWNLGSWVVLGVRESPRRLPDFPNVTPSSRLRLPIGAPRPVVPESETLGAPGAKPPPPKADDELSDRFSMLELE